MEALTLGDLIEAVREDLDDEVGPFLWSDPSLTRFLNEAVEEACLRARLLVVTGGAHGTIKLVPGVSEYALPSSVILIRRAALLSNPNDPLLRTTTAALDGHKCSWRTDLGVPQYLVRDQVSRQLSLSPIPEREDTLQLTVWRNPNATEIMETNDDEPVIDPMHHRKLVHWACWRAFNKKDVERYSPDDAARHMEQFELYFGERPTARALQQLSTDPVTGTQAHWF